MADFDPYREGKKTFWEGRKCLCPYADEKALDRWEQGWQNAWQEWDSRDRTGCMW